MAEDKKRIPKYHESFEKEKLKEIEAVKRDITDLKILLGDR